MGVHSGYNSFLLKQKENSGSVTATFRDQEKCVEELDISVCMPWLLKNMPSQGQQILNIIVNQPGHVQHDA